MGYPTLRRLYLANRRAALAVGGAYLDEAAFWRWKQERLAWPALPSSFPSRAKLIAEGYTTVRDLDGADEDELTELGLTRSQAQGVLGAMQEWPPMIPTIRKDYVRQDGRAAEVYDAPLFGLVARTTTTVSDTYEAGDMDTFAMTLTVSAASGTSPTLDVILETSPDGVTGWQRFGTFAQMTATGSIHDVFGPCDRYVRSTATIGGTNPSFTFSLLGEAK